MGRYDVAMILRMVALVTVISSGHAQSPDTDRIFLKAYFLHHEKGETAEALNLYRDYLQKAPAGNYADKAQRGIQQIGVTAPVSSAGRTALRIKAPNSDRLHGSGGLRRLDQRIAAANATGRFLEAARLRSKKQFMIVTNQVAAELDSDDRALTRLVAQRDRHTAFLNQEAAASASKEIDALLMLKQNRTTYEAVRGAMMAREARNDETPGSSFCIFLYDLGGGVKPAWMEQIRRFRQWLGDSAARSSAAAADIDAATAIAHDLANAVELIGNGKRAEVQPILNRIWAWVNAR